MLWRTHQSIGGKTPAEGVIEPSLAWYSGFVEYLT